MAKKKKLSQDRRKAQIIIRDKVFCEILEEFISTHNLGEALDKLKIKRNDFDDVLKISEDYRSKYKDALTRINEKIFKTLADDAADGDTRSAKAASDVLGELIKKIEMEEDKEPLIVFHFPPPKEFEDIKNDEPVDI